MDNDTFSPLVFESSFSLFLMAVINSTKMASLSFIFSIVLNRGSLPYFTANSLNVVLDETADKELKTWSIKIPLLYLLDLLHYLGDSLASSIILLNSSLACISLFFFSFLSSSARVFTYWSKTWMDIITQPLKAANMWHKKCVCDVNKW